MLELTQETFKKSMTERGKRRRKNEDGEKTREGRDEGEETTRSEERKLEEKADPVFKTLGIKITTVFPNDKCNRNLDFCPICRVKERLDIDKFDEISSAPEF